MNEISSIDNQAILQELNQRDNSSGSDSGRTDFLKLLVAQLNNQNPLSPQENGEFLSQLAQFSTVEGIEKLNSNFDQFVTSNLSNQALQASALVGRSVQVPINTGELTSGKALTGSIELPASSANVSLSIFDINGSLVRQIPMGAHGAGNVKFSWDGFDSSGAPMPSGSYVVAAEASMGENAEQLNVRVNANVDSVTMAQSGGVILNLEGSLGSIALNDIVQIN
jgi:flagellar basal-body rod modification protein FlgD